MIAVAVLAIIAVLAMPKFSTMVLKSREGKTKAHLGALRSAVTVYYADNDSRYPVGDPAPSLIPKYLQAVPECWTAPHGASREVRTYGAGVADGGEWGYWLPGAAPEDVQGRFFVSCTHADRRGQVWSTQ
jgi:type II secretory pathway pseudopilin PulG